MAAPVPPAKTRARRECAPTSRRAIGADRVKALVNRARCCGRARFRLGQGGAYVRYRRPAQCREARVAARCFLGDRAHAPAARVAHFAGLGFAHPQDRRKSVVFARAVAADEAQPCAIEMAALARSSRSSPKAHGDVVDNQLRGLLAMAGRTTEPDERAPVVYTMPNLAHLPLKTEEGLLRVVVETPTGSRRKSTTMPISKASC